MYVIQNQHDYFLAKNGEWLDGREPTQLYKTNHKDEALNQMFEANSRDYSLRLQLLDCEINAKKQPIIPEDKLPPVAPQNAGLSSQNDENLNPGRYEDLAPMDQELSDIA
jgi:hypothetical protein